MNICPTCGLVYPPELGFDCPVCKDKIFKPKNKPKDVLKSQGRG